MGWAADGVWPGRAAHTHVPAVGARAELTVLTTLQWFFGPTWGSTLRTCGRGQKSSPRCVQAEEVQARQLELIEVLRRNALHPAVGEVHVLVAEAPPVRRLLQSLPWYAQGGNATVRLVQIGERPTFRSYMNYLSAALVGRVVVFTNQDVFLAGDGWHRLPAALPPKTTFFLSRHPRPPARPPARRARRTAHRWRRRQVPQ